MTGRMYVVPLNYPLPKHAAVVLGLGKEMFVFEDTRYFGRLMLNTNTLESLGPEPLSQDFCVAGFTDGLARSSQSIKVKLLDQSLVAGIGNIYASEALHRAGISPRTSACRLSLKSIVRLWRAIRETLADAIRFGSTVSLDYAGAGGRNGLFYYGSSTEPQRSQGGFEERLQVYDRAGEPCLNCGSKIRRIVQSARSTFYCPGCQR
jgi:formamidopyrimidine-DNA glycosylase